MKNRNGRIRQASSNFLRSEKYVLHDLDKIVLSYYFNIQGKKVTGPTDLGDESNARVAQPSNG